MLLLVRARHILNTMSAALRVSGHGLAARGRGREPSPRPPTCITVRSPAQGIHRSTQRTLALCLHGHVPPAGGSDPSGRRVHPSGSRDRSLLAEGPIPPPTGMAPSGLRDPSLLPEGYRLSSARDASPARWTAPLHVHGRIPPPRGARASGPRDTPLLVKGHGPPPGAMHPLDAREPSVSVEGPAPPVQGTHPSHAWGMAIFLEACIPPGRKGHPHAQRAPLFLRRRPRPIAT